MKLEINDIEQNEGVARVALKGVVNIQTAIALRRHLKPMLVARHKHIHIDLSEVGFIDSAGLATLVEGLQWSRAAKGRTFVLSGLCDNVRDIFELAKLDTVFEIESAGKTA